VSETTPYERVRHVIAHTYESVSVDAIADDARTSPKTARKHLNALANEGSSSLRLVNMVERHIVARQNHSSLKQAADILEQVSTDELTTRITEMRDQLSSYQSEYSVDSPEELAVEQTNQALSESASAQRDIDAETIQEWQTLRRNLAFANAALDRECSAIR